MSRGLTMPTETTPSHRLPPLPAGRAYRFHKTELLGHEPKGRIDSALLEQHIRAIAGWPLGPTKAHARVEMTNLLGDEVEQWSKLAARPDQRLHLYGKAEARPGRKMAHVNRVRMLS